VWGECARAIGVDAKVEETPREKRRKVEAK